MLPVAKSLQERSYVYLKVLNVFQTEDEMMWKGKYDYCFGKIQWKEKQEGIYERMNGFEKLHDQD